MGNYKSEFTTSFCPQGRGKGAEKQTIYPRTLHARVFPSVLQSPTKCIYLTNVTQNSLAADEVYLMAVKQVKHSLHFLSLFMFLSKKKKKTELVTALYTLKQNRGIYLGSHANFTQ